MYRELYYRHIYSRLTPTIEHRFHSYENYCDLFNYILSKSTRNDYGAHGRINTSGAWQGKIKLLVSNSPNFFNNPFFERL